MNYRLGAFGWLGGDKFMDDGGYPNVGLWDQRAAIEWVRGYIHLFGGDTRRNVYSSHLWYYANKATG